MATSIATKSIFLGDMRVATVDSNGKTLFYHGDHLGGTNIVSDSTGNVKELTEYEPFGQYSRHEKYGSSDEVAKFYFTGKQLDEATGLYYFGARYYNPTTARFLTPDSLVPRPSNPQEFNRYSYVLNNPINRIDPDGHKSWWSKFWKAAVTAIVGTALIIVSGGTLAPVIGTYWAGVATGAMVGATIGGTFAAATGGNIGMGLLTGAVGGGLFAGLTPAFTGMMNVLYTGTSQVSLIGSAATVSNFVSSSLAGAISGATVAGINGTDVGQGALIGGATAGAYSLVRDTGKYLRAKMIAQSRIDSNNKSGVSAGLDGDGFKLGGSRWDNTPGAKNAPSPLGGLQGGQGKFFGLNYPAGGVVDHIVESWAGPHDYLNSWAYASDGTLRQLSGFEGVVGGITNGLNVAIAAPVAVPLMIGPNGAAAPAVIYGYKQRH